MIEIGANYSAKIYHNSVQFWNRKSFSQAVVADFDCLSKTRAMLHGHMNTYADYAHGWHKGGVALLRSIDGLQPDRAPTMTYEAYPQPVVAPYHYEAV